MKSIPFLKSSRKRTRKTGKRVFRRNLSTERLENRALLAGIVWSEGPTLLEPRAEAVAVQTGTDRTYLLGGGLSTVEVLSSATDHWIAAQGSPKNPTGPAATFVGGNVLVFGGRYGDQATEEAFDYDYLAGDSEDIANLPTPRYDHAFATDGLGGAFAIGGIERSGEPVFDIVERYDLAADTWTETAPLPEPRVNAVATYDGNGHILVFGGSSDEAGTALQSSVISYDVTSDQWTTRTSMPVPTTESAIAVDSDGVIYLVGGKDASGPTGIVQVYDPLSNSWSTETALPAPIYSAAAMVDSDDRLNVIGGYSDDGTTLGDTWRSQPLHLPDEVPVITTHAKTFGAADQSYVYDVNATGNPPPTYALVSAPAGMSIDGQTGIITWAPTDAQVGTQSVIVRAENRAGSFDQSYDINVAGDTTAPTVPQSFQVTNVSETTADLTWDASFDAKGVDHYTIYVGYRCGWRGRNTCYRVFEDNVIGTGMTLADLTGSYKLRVAAFDAAGNKSGLSSLVAFSMQTPPRLLKYDVPGYRTAADATANFEMRTRIYTSGNPAPTMRLVSGPENLTFDPATGLVSWTPTATQLGTHEAIIEATNEVSTVSLSLPITVTADLPVLSFSASPASGVGSIVPREPVVITTFDASRTPSTFEILSGSTGAVIDPLTGAITWTPEYGDVGVTSIEVKATNAAGSTISNALVHTSFVSEPTSITIAGDMTLEPTVSWNAPSAGAVEEIAGYKILLYRRYRWGRAWRTEQITIDSAGTSTTAALTGMKENVPYKVYVTPYDALGNNGIRSSEAITFSYTPSLPRLTYSIAGFNDTTSVVALQPMTIQISDINPMSVGTTFELVAGPSGLAVDRTTGLVNWTPDLSASGTTINATIRATNTLGSRTITIPVNVLFSGSVLNLSAVRDGNTVHASWDPPSTNADPVASYRITRYYRWSSRRRSVTWTVPATTTSLDFSLYPTGAVWHTGMSVTPIRADGAAGIGVKVSYI
ncbi:kelch repeat-containing protein [Roseiconus sp. JC912]